MFWVTSISIYYNLTAVPEHGYKLWNNFDFHSWLIIDKGSIRNRQFKIFLNYKSVKCVVRENFLFIYFYRDDRKIIPLRILRMYFAFTLATLHVCFF